MRTRYIRILPSPVNLLNGPGNRANAKRQILIVEIGVRNFTLNFQLLAISHVNVAAVAAAIGEKVDF